MKAQTKKAIAAEISKLKRMKPYVQRFSMFGDDNHKKIEAQIMVLLDCLDQDDIDGRWGAEEDMDLHMSAEGAMNWRDGTDEEEPPSEGWMILAKKGGFKK
jgi:hypothetical protein